MANHEELMPRQQRLRNPTYKELSTTDDDFLLSGGESSEFESVAAKKVPRKRKLQKKRPDRSNRSDGQTRKRIRRIKDDSELNSATQLARQREAQRVARLRDVTRNRKRNGAAAASSHDPLGEASEETPHKSRSRSRPSKRKKGKRARAPSPSEEEEEEEEEKRPPAPLSDTDDIFRVERIVKHAIRGGKLNFWIKWDGYESSENTWQDESDLMTCEELLRDYVRQNRSVIPLINMKRLVPNHDSVCIFCSEVVNAKTDRPCSICPNVFHKACAKKTERRSLVVKNVWICGLCEDRERRGQAALHKTLLARYLGKDSKPVKPKGQPAARSTEGNGAAAAPPTRAGKQKKKEKAPDPDYFTTSESESSARDDLSMDPDFELQEESSGSTASSRAEDAGFGEEWDSDEWQAFHQPSMSVEAMKKVASAPPSPSKKAVAVNPSHPPDEPTIPILPHVASRLKPHQLEGIRFMWDNVIESVAQFEASKAQSEGLGCILSHAMGLGKTLQIITLLHAVLQRTSARKACVVAPLSTLKQWVWEFRHWLKMADCPPLFLLSDNVTSTKERFQVIESWQEKSGVLVVGYVLFKRLLQARIKRTAVITDAAIAKAQAALRTPDILVCDEAHCLKGVSQLTQTLSTVQCGRRICLTGTPLQNNLEEYWHMVSFVKPNLLGSIQEFRNGFINPIENGRAPGSTDYDTKLMRFRSFVLHQMLSGFVHRRSHDVVANALPPKHEAVLFLRLTPEQIKLYNTLIPTSKGTFQEATLASVWNHPNVLRRKLLKIIAAAQARLEPCASPCPFVGKHVCVTADELKVPPGEFAKLWLKRDAPYPTSKAVLGIDTATLRTADSTFDLSGKEFPNPSQSSKVMVFLAILKACREDKILVFSQSTQTLDVLETVLKFQKRAGYLRLDGQTPAKERHDMVKDFNAFRAIKLFLISTRAGGLGLNLAAANRVIIFDNTWNPANEQQALCRVYRYGQKKPVFVYRLVTAGTLESDIYYQQVRKLGLQNQVIEQRFQYRRDSCVRARDSVYTPSPPLDRGLLRGSRLCEHDRVLKELFASDVAPLFAELPVAHDALFEENLDHKLTADEKVVAKEEYETDKKSGFASRWPRVGTPSPGPDVAGQPPEASAPTAAATVNGQQLAGRASAGALAPTPESSPALEESAATSPSSSSAAPEESPEPEAAGGQADAGANATAAKPSSGAGQRRDSSPALEESGESRGPSPAKPPGAEAETQAKAEARPLKRTASVAAAEDASSCEAAAVAEQPLRQRQGKTKRRRGDDGPTATTTPEPEASPPAPEKSPVSAKQPTDGSTAPKVDPETEPEVEPEMETTDEQPGVEAQPEREAEVEPEPELPPAPETEVTAAMEPEMEPEAELPPEPEVEPEMETVEEVETTTGQHGVEVQQEVQQEGEKAVQPDEQPEAPARMEEGETVVQPEAEAPAQAPTHPVDLAAASSSPALEQEQEAHAQASASPNELESPGSQVWEPAASPSLKGDSPAPDLAASRSSSPALGNGAAAGQPAAAIATGSSAAPVPDYLPLAAGDAPPGVDVSGLDDSCLPFRYVQPSNADLVGPRGVVNPSVLTACDDVLRKYGRKLNKLAQRPDSLDMKRKRLAAIEAKLPRLELWKQYFADKLRSFESRNGGPKPQ